ncbi:MAG: pyridoxamine 5'-phosphate oxidase family protein [Gaiellales bacterium]
MSLPENVLELARGANFAAFTVHLKSGDAMTHVMWVDADDDHVLINTEIHRDKFKAVERDPRVSVMIWNRDNPYSFAEIRGKVVETIGGAEARTHIDTLSHKYTGSDYSSPITSERVILKIAPHAFGGR